ncbi:unnamed protein product [Coffea canephora]|uniref:Uncharacterized protein n=1 Tax=Coffea canephora TaxID=49390 RepID=A0A068UZ81_COFCA|nr:unnamed protein product [Coffea canephora]
MPCLGYIILCACEANWQIILCLFKKSRIDVIIYLLYLNNLVYYYWNSNTKIIGSFGCVWSDLVPLNSCLSSIVLVKFIFQYAFLQVLSFTLYQKMHFHVIFFFFFFFFWGQTPIWAYIKGLKEVGPSINYCILRNF